MYEGARRAYSQKMTTAQGRKLGTTAQMTIMLLVKLNVSWSTLLAEFWSAPSTVPMSEVKRLRILPKGVYIV
jgi:hypothetical protein